MVVATKVGRIVQPDGVIVFDFSRDGVLRSVEASLTRLGLDRVEILHIHDADHHLQEALNETLPALLELRQQGMIRAVGAGMNQWEALFDFGLHGGFDCFLLAGRYTLLEHEASQGFLRLCAEKGISVFLGGVFNSGILARGAAPGAKYNYADAPPAVARRARGLEHVCARHRVSLRVAALHFALAQPQAAAVILGAETPEEICANLQALDAAIPLALWEDLRREGFIHAAAPTPGEGGLAPAPFAPN